MTSYLENASRKSEQFHAKYGNQPWKANGIFLLWSFGQLFKFSRPMRPKSDDVCRVGFWLKGGVGDILISLNWLQNFHRFLDGALAFDLYVQEKRGACEIVQTLCRKQSFVKQVLPVSQVKRDYDLYIEMMRYPDIIHCNESKIRELCPRLHQWCMVVDRFRRENPIVYRSGTYGEHIGIKLATLQGHNRLRQADIDHLVQVESVFQPNILADTNETLAKFSLENKRFITMQRGVGGRDRNVSNRLWPLNHYETLARLIKKRTPEVCIVQIGTEKNLPINGVDIDLRDKTSFEDVMILMQKSSCHIDGECGLVHLRHFLQGGPSVVLFGPTERQFYGHSENINILSDACVGGCEWITPVYVAKCPRGFDENVCLTCLSPEVVLKYVLEIVECQ
ncbi:MAG: glycosyltransferase family 9 protein [Thermoguttaceae bacterium]